MGEDFWDYVFVLFVFKLVKIVDLLFDMVNIDGIEYNNIVELFRINGLFIWILYLWFNLSECGFKDMVDV